MIDVRRIVDLETARGLTCAGALAGLLLGPTVLGARWLLAALMDTPLAEASGTQSYRHVPTDQAVSPPGSAPPSP